jgi:uncharacterized protein YjiS (DUF1127 family)
MTVISVSAGARRRKPPSIVNALLRLSAQAKEQRRIGKEMRELSRLSPHLLRDIGMDQCAAPREPTIQVRWH